MLPSEFLDRMKELLGEEYGDFYTAITEKGAVRGARVNLIKADAETVPQFEGAETRKIEYARAGYIIDGDAKIGESALHHAGIVYMQDPGAMSALEAIDIPEGMWVADLCAAPGGKSSQIAERLGSRGFLLSNEYVPKRAKIIVANFERLGVRNAMVTSMDTAKLAEYFPEVFDIVVCDAPCSGEGMFRKNEDAISEWSPDNVERCKERQAEILENAYRMLKPGGKLIYSTCTFNLSENEITVKELIDRHPDMKIIPVLESVKRATTDGIEICEGMNLSETRRVYPHVTEGEGQYFAIMEKGGEPSGKQTFVYKERLSYPTKDEMKILGDFLVETIGYKPEGRYIKNGDEIILISHGCPVPPHSVFMSGVVIGELKRGVLHPHHQFFSAYGCEFLLKEELSGDRLARYLRGEEIETELTSRGYIALTYLGSAIGGGKLSCGRIKNHYPKGLRNK